MFSQQDNPDFVYYNGNIIPDVSNTSHIHGQIMFNDSLIDNLIESANKYEFAIDRVQFDASLLPVWIPLLNPSINDGQTTLYTVYMWLDNGINAGPGKATMTYSNTDYILFHAPNTNDYYNNPYYWVNSMKRFVDMLNETITTCYNTVKAQITDDGGTFNNKCPFVRFDSASELFSIYFDKNGLPGGTGGTLMMGFNTQLQLLLRHFNYSQVNLISFDNDIGFVLNPYDDYGLNSLTYNSIDYIFIEQESRSVEFFSPVSSIVFSSDQLPIVGDITSLPKTLTDSLYAPTSIGSSQKIITDIVVSMTSLFDYKQIITYIPTQYRWTSMKGTDIKKINFSVEWRSKYNAKLYPVFLSSLGYCSFKFVFRKK